MEEFRKFNIGISFDASLRYGTPVNVAEIWATHVQMYRNNNCFLNYSHGVWLCVQFVRRVLFFTKIAPLLEKLVPSEPFRRRTDASNDSSRSVNVSLWNCAWKYDGFAAMRSSRDEAWNRVGDHVVRFKIPSIFQYFSFRSIFSSINELKWRCRRFEGLVSGNKRKCLWIYRFYGARIQRTHIIWGNKQCIETKVINLRRYLRNEIDLYLSSIPLATKLMEI